MKSLRVYLDSFSGALSDLPKGQRVSTFERGPAWLEHLLSELKGNGLIVEESEPYPWHRYSLTEAGRRMLESDE